MTEDKTFRSRHAADRIHGFLATRFVTEGALSGPDPGVRFNYRFWRFFKSYTPRLAWKDDWYYLQSQGYWILGNWKLSQSNSDIYTQQAIASSDHVIRRQRRDGAWDYPNPEWEGRVATVEGIWASLGLMESYRRTGSAQYINAALRWHAFLETKIGYQQFGSNIAVNYFAHDRCDPVPNNSALALRYLASLFAATGDRAHLDRCDGLLEFLTTAQLPSGEVPYVYGDPKRVHFQCFQYQAFLYLDVREYYRLTGNQRAREVMVRLLGFLKRGISPRGFAYYQCGQKYRTVNYHTCAIATALASGLQFEVAGCDMLSERALQYVIAQQRDDGSLPHSQGDYRILSDRRSYPRYLAMMMYHLTNIASDYNSHNATEETRDLIARG